jgi:Fe2+ or Zn2+ uptake regulation protein
MALKKPTQVKIILELYKIIPPKGVEWSGIMQQLEKQYAISNWLTTVRAPLQALKNAGIIARTKDVYKEVWYRIPTDGEFTEPQILLAVGI